MRALEKQKRLIGADQKAVPKSVDLLLKKQEKLCKEILYRDDQSQQKPQFISGANLPRHQSRLSEQDVQVELRLKELREINQQLALPSISRVKNSHVH